MKIFTDIFLMIFVYSIKVTSVFTGIGLFGIYLSKQKVLAVKEMK